MEKKTWARNWGEPKPKTRASCARFQFQIWGDRSHCIFSHFSVWPNMFRSHSTPS